MDSQYDRLQFERDKAQKEIATLRAEVEKLTANNAQYKAALNEWSEQTVAGNKQYEKAITETAIAEARAATLRAKNEKLVKMLGTVEMSDAFAEWFAKNYPRDTLIYVPAWHAPRIFRAVLAHVRAALQENE
jgi:chromosome segregation ATPase